MSLKAKGHLSFFSHFTQFEFLTLIVDRFSLLLYYFASERNILIGMIAGVFIAMFVTGIIIIFVVYIKR